MTSEIMADMHLIEQACGLGQDIGLSSNREAYAKLCETDVKYRCLSSRLWLYRLLSSLCNLCCIGCNFYSLCYMAENLVKLWSRTAPTSLRSCCSLTWTWPLIYLEFCSVPAVGSIRWTCLFLRFWKSWKGFQLLSCPEVSHLSPTVAVSRSYLEVSFDRTKTGQMFVSVHSMWSFKSFSLCTDVFLKQVLRFNTLLMLGPRLCLVHLLHPATNKKTSNCWTDTWSPAAGCCYTAGWSRHGCWTGTQVTHLILLLDGWVEDV